MRIDAFPTYSFPRPVAERGVPDALGIDAPVPERVRDACPEARILYVLRDPVERAASSLRHRARTDPALAGEASPLQAMRGDPTRAVRSSAGSRCSRAAASRCSTLPTCARRSGGSVPSSTSRRWTRLGRLTRTHGGFREAARAILPPGLRAEAAALFADDLDKLEALTGMRPATAYAPKGRDAAS